MKRISPEDITEKLSEEKLEALAEMASENPVPNEWIECSKKLNDEQKFQVYEKRGELRERKEQERINSMSKEEKEKEDERYN
jgi:flagellar motor switch protein FliM